MENIEGTEYSLSHGTEHKHGDTQPYYQERSMPRERIEPTNPRPAAERVLKEHESLENGSGGKKNGTGKNGYEKPEFKPAAALKVTPVFCPEEVADPFDTVEWATRSASIKGDNGELVFEQTDCEFPKTWSQLAINVVASKYFYGEPGTPEREKGIRQVILRVARTIADWGIQDGYFASPQDGENFYRDLVWLCVNQCVAFNSPVWFNVGLYHQYGIRGTQCNWRWSEPHGEAVQPQNPYEYPQASACFIQSVEDNMEAIMDLARSEALLFKFGSGTGSDLSTLRSCREKLSGGGKPSGPLSFMRVYDQIAAVVKSGGKTRRAAKMQSLKIWHPDVMEFIDCKQHEEDKARILVRHGLHWEDAYSSVMYQNANLSVRVTDEFMRAVKNDGMWATHWVTEPAKNGPEYRARDVFGKIAENAWRCGDPGLQYDSTINRWNTCANSGQINASNPCSEFMFLDDSACNLASINLMRFRQEGGGFDHKRFTAAARIIFIAQDILVDHGSYPVKKVAENSHRFRPIGLGYSNLGSLIMSLGLPYDSDEARGLCSVITALLHGAAYKTSAELAGSIGVFEKYQENKVPMLRVMEMHWDAVNKINTTARTLKSAARELWDEVLELGRRNGFRNAQATVLAPTGTISFMMDCDTTGIEPDIALVKFKQLAGGGTLKIVNQTVPLALETLGYKKETIRRIKDFIEQNRTIEGAPDLLPQHQTVFDCAFPTPGSDRCIPWQAHIRMMAAAQPFISGAISKTVNMPSSATEQDIADAYMMGWELGLKAVAVYRDGSKTVQPLSTSGGEDSGTETEPSDKKKKKSKKADIGTPRREYLPDTRKSMTHKFNVAGHDGYITVGFYDDGRPGEMFITMAKEGSTIGGLMDCFSTALSMSLQYGVPLSVYVNKFSHTRFEPQGYTKNPDIPIAKSIVDYIFRWLGRTCFDEKGNPVLYSSAEYSAPKKEPEPASVSRESDKAGQSVSLGGKNKDESAAENIREKPENRLTLRPPQMDTKTASLSAQFATFQSDAPACDSCGAITVRSGNCYLCYNCGKSMGCS
ncbi:MAG: vitamin B12-dependent ribonucleotide reductase [Planctomycetaceae bacterium]|nr:vitamin B12-dependent ribonucleotide reductase [Planctomycetaceae bacterium]